jgi:hypothetical protein
MLNILQGVVFDEKIRNHSSDIFSWFECVVSLKIQTDDICAVQTNLSFL